MSSPTSYVPLFTLIAATGGLAHVHITASFLGADSLELSPVSIEIRDIPTGTSDVRVEHGGNPHEFLLELETPYILAFDAPGHLETHLFLPTFAKTTDLDITVQLAPLLYFADLSSAGIVGSWLAFPGLEPEPLERRDDGNMELRPVGASPTDHYRISSISHATGPVSNPNQRGTVIMDSLGKWATPIALEDGTPTILLETQTLTPIIYIRPQITVAPPMAWLGDLHSIASSHHPLHRLLASGNRDPKAHTEAFNACIEEILPTAFPTDEAADTTASAGSQEDSAAESGGIDYARLKEQTGLLEYARMSNFTPLGPERKIARHIFSEIPSTSPIWAPYFTQWQSLLQVMPDDESIEIAEAFAQDSSSKSLRRKILMWLVRGHMGDLPGVAARAGSTFDLYNYSDLLMSEWSDDPDARRLVQRATAPDAIRAYECLPDILVTDLVSNDTFPLAPAREFAYTLLDFWSAYDAASVEGRPQLTDFAMQFGGRGLAIMSISLGDDPAALELFRRDIHPMAWPQARLSADRSESLRDLLPIERLPYRTLIDREGMVLATGLELEGAEILPLLEALLPPTRAPE